MGVDSYLRCGSVGVGSVRCCRSRSDGSTTSCGTVRMILSLSLIVVCVLTSCLVRDLYDWHGTELDEVQIPPQAHVRDRRSSW